MTQELLRHLKESRIETAYEWSREAYVGETGDQTLQANAKALGGIDLLNKLIEKLEAYNEEEIEPEEKE